MSNSPWISVKEQLPDKDGKYFALIRDNNYPTCTYFCTDLHSFDDYYFPFEGDKGRRGWIEYYDGVYWERDDVNYWMPVPELN